MLRIVTRPVQAIEACFTGSRAQPEAMRASPPGEPAPAARPIMLSPRPTPPRGWPTMFSEAAALPYLRQCLLAGPEHFVTALVRAPSRAHPPHCQPYVALLRECVRLHGAPRVKACMRRAITARQVPARLLSLVVVAAPEWLKDLAEPKHVRDFLYSGFSLQALFEALPGGQALEWAQHIFAQHDLKVMETFFEASAQARWRDQVPALAEALPGPLWKLLLRGRSEAAFSGWRPKESARGPLTRDEAEALARTNFSPADPMERLLTAVRHAPDEASAQAIFDGLLAAGAHYRRGKALLACGQARGLNVAAALAEAAPSSVRFADWVHCLRKLPPDQARVVKVTPPHVWGDLIQDVPAARLALLAWLTQHQRPERDAWRRYLAQRYPRGHVHVGEPEQVREARHLRGYAPWEDRSWLTSPTETKLRLLNLMAPREGARGKERPPTAFYPLACEALGVPAAEAERWRPWGEAPERKPHEVLPLLSTCLGQDADPGARDALQSLPACVERVLGLAVHDGERPWPEDLPPRVLHMLAEALKQNASPAGAEVLRALEPRWSAIPEEERLDWAEASIRQGLSPWPWLQRVGKLDDRRASRWGAALASLDAYTAPADEVATSVQAWVEAALAQTTGPGLFTLLAWLAAHPACTHDVARAFARVSRTASPPETEAQREGARAYILSRSPDVQEALTKLHPRLFAPPELLHLHARRWLPPSAALPAQALHGAETLLSTLRRPLPEHAELPELQLDAEEAALPPWAREALCQEPTGLTGDAAFAQANRRRALACYLYWCRAAHVPPARRDAGGTLALQLLRLPDDAIRHTLLRQLVAGLTDSPDRRASDAFSVAQTQTPRAMPLAFAVAWLFHGNAQAGAPHVTLLPRSRAVHNHGARQRALLDLIASVMRIVMHEGVGRGPDAAFARGVVGWADDRNLARMLDNANNRQRRAELLRLAREAGRSSEALQALREEMSRHETVCATRLALRADCAARGEGRGHEADARTLLPLRQGFAWLAKRPACKAVAQEAASLCAPAALKAQGTPAALTRLRAALKASKVSRQERWPTALCDLLLLDLQSLRCAPEAASRHVAWSGTTAPQAPTAAFFRPQAVRTFMHDQVLPLMLELMDSASLLSARGKQPADFDQAGGVLSSCLDWTGLPDRALSALQARPDLHYLTTYVSSMRANWPIEDQARGRSLVRNAVAALAGGRLDAWRRQGPQARKLLKGRGGARLMERWERCTPLPTPGLPGLQLRDTGEPDTMLAATTSVSSCQSAKGGDSNRGMLSRVQDGAKRMVVLENAQGHIVSRATARLVHVNGAPALLLSSVYAGRETRAAQVNKAFNAWAKQRARQLGVAAYCSSSASLGTCVKLEIRCAGDSTPDYWDESGGLKDGNRSFKVICTRLDGAAG